MAGAAALRVLAGASRPSCLFYSLVLPRVFNFSFTSSVALTFNNTTKICSWQSWFRPQNHSGRRSWLTLSALQAVWSPSALRAWVEWRRRGLRSQTGMGWVGSPSYPPLRHSKLQGGRWFQIRTASGRKMVSDGGQTAARGESRRASLTSLSFLHSTDLLRAEYLISTPFISSTDGTGQHWPTRRPIRPRVQQRCFSKHGSLTATRIALSWSRFAREKGVWQRLPAPPQPQDPLRPAPAPEALGRNHGLEAPAVCGGLEAGRCAQPQPHEKSRAPHLPAALSWLLTPLLGLHARQEPAFEVA